MANPPRNTVAGQVFNDLRNKARRDGRPTDELLVLYVLERWLYRATISPYRDRFVLKGGLLLAALDARRPTRDGDLLAYLQADESEVVRWVCEVASIAVDDGISFLVDQARAQTIREAGHYAGTRVTMLTSIGAANVKLALDVYFGDPVTPGAVLTEYPRLLEAGPGFQLLAYPVETVLAEKLTTAVSLGEANTRDRDWADIWRLTGTHDLPGDALTEALRRTAHHREVTLQPLSARIGRLAASRAGGYRRWRQRQAADAAAYPASFDDVVNDVVSFADPVLRGEARTRQWRHRSREWR